MRTRLFCFSLCLLSSTSPALAEIAYENPNKLYKIGIGGFAQEDFAFFKDDKVNHQDDHMLRRGRLNVFGHVLQDWNYKVEMDFANHRADFTDVILNYKGFSPVELTVGQFKEPFSLDRLTSDRFVTFLEGASVMALVPERHLGAQAKTGSKNWTLAGGVFGDNINDGGDDTEQYSMTARFTMAPIAEAGKVLHFGAAGSYRHPNNHMDNVRYRSRFETRLADTQAVDTGAVNDVDNIILSGLEFAGVWNQWSVQAEYIRSDVERFNAAEDLDFDGYYVMGSYFLTGESRNYNTGSATFDRVKPLTPFSINDKTWGAWEVVARYSEFDANDHDVKGGELRNMTAGLNWYPLENLRFMADYTKVHTDKESVIPGDSPDVFMLRAQFDF